MKRKTIALLLHPYKNGLLQRTALQAAINRFFEELFSLQQSFPQLRFNIVVPAYILECTNLQLIAQLRELCKRSIVELLCTGYTEPFMSLSPPELTIKNIQYGLQVIEDLTGQKATGFVPPFSNWEPSLIAKLRELGFRYALLSNELFTPETRNECGYWIAEHAGSSISLLAANVLQPASAPGDLVEWLRLIYSRNPTSSSDDFAAIQYLIPLKTEATDDTYQYLRGAAEQLEKHLLTYQPVCFHEQLGASKPIGLQYIPTSLQMGRRGTVDLHFLNYLFSFDQIGILQRKMLDTFDQCSLVKQTRSTMEMLKTFFSIQDINRFLPGKDSGFENSLDRAITYERLIETDHKLHLLSGRKGGRIRIFDFLRNGGKTIVLSNKNIKAFIDFRNGGQIFDYDFRRRAINLCSAYNPQQRHYPDIVVPGASCTWFLDRILPEVLNNWDSSASLLNDTGDFKSGTFDYKVRKTASGVNVSLVRTGSFLSGERSCPLQIEKVFGLEEDSAVLSFVYQFTNPSLMSCKYTFATELNVSLAGIITEAAILHAGKNTYRRLSRDLLNLPGLTQWSIEDRTSGVRLHVQTQKPMTLWCLPASPDVTHSESVRCVLTSGVTLEPSSQWKIMGKITCKSIRKNSEAPDEL